MSLTWQLQLSRAISSMLKDRRYAPYINDEHARDTPDRVVKMYEELFSGCSVDTAELLRKAKFPIEDGTQMIHVENIAFYSVCSHHLLPIIGRAHFAYIPRNYIVGLSKIPRLVEAFAKRPQVQEELTHAIVSEFMDIIAPQGCGLMMVARHGCMECRGVRATTARMRTTAIRGSFLTDQKVREEFMATAALNREE